MLDGRLEPQLGAAERAGACAAHHVTTEHGTPKRRAPRCNGEHHVATECTTLQRSAPRCNGVQPCGARPAPRRASATASQAQHDTRVHTRGTRAGTRRGLRSRLWVRRRHAASRRGSPLSTPVQVRLPPRVVHARATRVRPRASESSEGGSTLRAQKSGKVDLEQAAASAQGLSRRMAAGCYSKPAIRSAAAAPTQRAHGCMRRSLAARTATPSGTRARALPHLLSVAEYTSSRRGCSRSGAASALTPETMTHAREP
jgi:hypothetical protein